MNRLEEVRKLQKEVKESILTAPDALTKSLASILLSILALEEQLFQIDERLQVLEQEDSFTKATTTHDIIQ